MNACSIDKDVLEFPDQDETLIGSRGVMLSGGKKQRIVSIPGLIVGGVLSD